MMIEQAKTWFLQKSQREQYILGIGGIAAVFLLVYALIWLPLANQVVDLRQQVSNQRALLTWMKQAKTKLQTMQQAPGASRQPANNVMVTVEHSLAQQELAKYLESVKQPQDKQVAINLKAVPFDKFIGWMQSLLRQYQLKVVQLNVTKSTRLGTTDVQFVMAPG